MSILLTSNTMSPQDFFLSPRENYVEEQPKLSEILFHPKITDKVKQLALLQRQKPTVGEDENSTVSRVADSQSEIMEKKVLKTLSILKRGQFEETKPTLRKNYETSDVGVNKDSFFTVDDP